MSDTYDWAHCDHHGAGQIGCATCDPDPARVRIRHERIEVKRLREEVTQLRAWQRAIGEGTGYINTAEGQGGYDVAPAEEIIAAWKERDATQQTVDELQGAVNGLDCDHGCGCGKRHCATGEEAECVSCMLTGMRMSAARGWGQADSLHISLREQRERAEKAEARVAELEFEVADLTGAVNR